MNQPMAPAQPHIRRRKARRGARGRSFAVVAPPARLQRSYVRAVYVRNHSNTSWGAFGRYLVRDDRRAGIVGQPFTVAHDEVDLPRALRQWQRAGDPWYWRLIVSPEHGERLDLRAHTRALVGHMERDLGTALEWAAVDHHDTAHAHVHLVVRGRDDTGRPLEIAPRYFEAGLRQRSQELATRSLGFRSEREQLAARGSVLERDRFTEVDRALLQRSDDRGLVRIAASARTGMARRQALQDIRRLRFLEGRGLAEHVESLTWRLSPTLESGLRRAQAQTYGPLARHRRRDRSRGRATEPIVTLERERRPQWERAR